jgi:hypothetical protein
MDNKQVISFIQKPRTDIQISLPDGGIISGMRGTTLEKLLSLLEE